MGVAVPSGVGAIGPVAPPPIGGHGPAAPAGVGVFGRAHGRQRGGHCFRCRRGCPAALTAAFVLSAPWADPQLGADGFDPKWNSVDGKINRKSHEGDYPVSDDNEPLNVRGRTGLKGRGVLGKWGPNHAADPIVTRWKRDSGGEVVKDPESGKPILQFVSIQRRDTKEWAIPGGMVDPGEQGRELIVLKVFLNVSVVWWHI